MRKCASRGMCVGARRGACVVHVVLCMVGFVANDKVQSASEHDRCLI
jgi:hypothetical protein